MKPLQASPHPEPDQALFNALFAVSVKMTESLELTALLQVIVEQATELLQGTGGGFYLCDPQNQTVNCAVSYKTSRDYTGTVLKYGEGVAGKIAQTGQPIIIDDYQTWSERSPKYETEKPFRAVISAPVTWQGQVTGVLHVLDNSAERKFTQQDLELLSLFANQSAVAIENIRLLESEHQHQKETEILRQIAAAVITGPDLNEVLDNILTLLSQVVQFDSATVFLHEGEFLRAKAARNLPRPDLVLDKNFPPNDLLMTEIARTGQPVILSDAQTDARFSNWGHTFYIQSWMGIPMIYKGQVIGYLTCDHHQKNIYTAKDAALAQAFANQAAIAIENARLFEAERAQLTLAHTLQEVGALLTSQYSLEEVLENLLDLLKRAVDYDSASIHLLSSVGKLYLAAGRGFPDIDEVSQVIDSLSDYLLESRWKTRQAEVISDTDLDERWRVTPETDKVRSWIGAPLLVKGLFIGGLNVDSHTPNAYDEDDRRTVMAFANQAAVAIENARLFEAERKRVAELEAVRQASIGVTASLEPTQVLYAILHSAMSMLPAALNAHIFLFDAETDELSFGAAIYADGTEGKPYSLPRPHGLTATVAHTGAPVVIENIAAHPLYESAPDDWEGAIVGLPLLIGQRVIGVMNISFSKPRYIPETELRALRLLADQAAIAIENARLYEQAATERRHLRLLFDISRELSPSLDPDQILSRAITLASQALGSLVGEAFLYIEEENRLSLRALYGRPENELRWLDSRLNLHLGRGLAGWVAQTRQSANIENVHMDPHWLELPDVDSDIASALCTPVETEGQLLGVLTVLNQKPNAFSNEHIQLMQAICQEVGLALSNAQRYQQVQRLSTLLAAQQKQLESLVEHLPFGVLLLNDDFHILVANPAGRRMLAVLNRNFSADSPLTRLGENSLQDLIDQQTSQLPVEITAPEPLQRIFSAQIATAGSPTGKGRGQWVLTLNDVTEERESLQRAQIQERLATVGQLAAGIAHDFNNIMAAILVYTDLLLYDPSLAPTSQEKLTIIQQQIQRASSLIRQILDFSRRSVMEQSEMDLLPLLKELDKMLVRILPETIQVQLSYQPSAYWVNGDPARLQQVFMNLALNARDAMPDGGSLRIVLSKHHLLQGSTRLMPEMPDGEWVRIVVSDTGTGIESDVREHIFEPFFTTKSVSQGTGLGLAQVYGIVRQHDGYIDVQSQPGRGTSFIIFLPAIEKAEESLRPVEQPRPLGGEGQSILVVEDDTSTRQALQVLLETVGYRTLVATNGVEALQLVEQSQAPIHLVISDMVMPQMGGLELYQTLKLKHPEIKMLLITGHPIDDMNQTLLEKGKVHWLQKPFTVQGLNLAIQGLLPRT